MDQRQKIEVEIDRVYVDDEHFTITYKIFEHGHMSVMSNIHKRHHWGENYPYFMDLLTNHGYATKLVLREYGKDKYTRHSYQGQSYTLLGKLKPQ